MLTTRRGDTLVEILAAAVIIVLMAGGTMMAFLMTRQISQGSSTTTEASSLVQQTLERFRNKIACRQSTESSSDTWYDASCAAAPPSPSSSDPLPAGPLRDQFGGTRTYTVTSRDCDAVEGTGDCLEVRVKVAWTQPQ